jgi:phosphoglycerol transferase MdoB-like AlkP superfamily enzyme
VTRDYCPADAPDGNWGVGDATLFSLAVERLKASRKPFYASILTASNHWPFTLPEDAPETIGRSQPMRLQLLQYVDFAFGKFWEAVARDFPHTLVVVVADHGVHYPDEPTPTAEIPFDVFRKHYRVPLLIAAPGLPAGVAGGVVSTPASQADIAPTVMTLLGETEWDNHFMGYDAFARREPIFFYWERTWRRLTWPRGFASAPTIDEQMVTATTYPFWEALVKQKRLMPKGRLGTHLQVRDK